MKQVPSGITEVDRRDAESESKPELESVRVYRLWPDSELEWVNFVNSDSGVESQTIPYIQMMVFAEWLSILLKTLRHARTYVNQNGINAIIPSNNRYRQQWQEHCDHFVHAI